MRNSRYYLVNFLNLFFSPTGTVEFRCHESTLNKDKALIWLSICACVLKYAEDTKKCLTAKKITIKEMISEFMDSNDVDRIVKYLDYRNSTFYASDGKTYKGEFKGVEAKWFKEDPDFEIKNIL